MICFYALLLKPLHRRTASTCGNFWLKGHKVSKEKLQSAQTQVQYFGHPISEQGLHLYPGRSHGILNFPKPKTLHQLQGILGLAGCYQNWISNFSLVAQPLYALLKSSKPDPNIRGDQHDIALKSLRKV